ncbi:MAG: FAD-dependent monooxygenase [Synechococcaceae cyanobacterium]|nr:FAD-dependent monooxygenase [Synechococcaceae cyanobacterium]
MAHRDPAPSSLTGSRLSARVNGAGPTGALSALALADAGWQVQLCDPLSAEQLQQRSRAYAFTWSSRLLLERLGLWQRLVPQLRPFRHLHLQDLTLEREADFGIADLPDRLSDAADPAVGWIAQHQPLMARLLEALADHPGVELRLGAPETVLQIDAAARTQVDAPPDLIVAADGPASTSRRALGIGQWRHTYRQACLTVQVEMRGCAENEAWELLRPEGPFAILPLGGRLFQLVWSAPASRCARLASQADSPFLDALAGALPDRFQPDGLRDDPRAFPVSLELARRLHRGRTILVGESGHRCHPVGGQGLNLCWRDVAVLHRLALRAHQGRLAPARLPAAYARRRWPDLLIVLVATDLLVRLFSNRNRLLLPLRLCVLRGLAVSSLLRRLSLTPMTLGPAWPGLPGRRSARTVCPW